MSSGSMAGCMLCTNRKPSQANRLPWLIAGIHLEIRAIARICQKQFGMPNKRYIIAAQPQLCSCITAQCFCGSGMVIMRMGDQKQADVMRIVTQ